MDRKYASGIQLGKKVADELLIKYWRFVIILNHFSALHIFSLLA
jgi:hypothetical protein